MTREEQEKFEALEMCCEELNSQLTKTILNNKILSRALQLAGEFVKKYPPVLFPEEDTQNFVSDFCGNNKGEKMYLYWLRQASEEIKKNN